MSTIEMCLAHGEAASLHPHTEQCRTETWPVVAGEVIDSQEFPVETSPALTLSRGDFAYIDAVRGLVPCKIVEVTADRITVRVTADRPGWNRGDLENFSNPSPFLVARAAVRNRRGHRVVIAQTTFAA